MIPVQCVRCRNKHSESDRVSQPVKKNPGMNELVCPRCGCKTYFNLTPSVAWCWASGLIEFGEPNEAPEAAIVFANGEHAWLRMVVTLLARHGQGASAGKLLVPGVPEAEGQMAAVDALGGWVDHCAKGNGHKGRHGVIFGRTL